MSLVAQMVKHLSTMREIRVRSLGQEDTLEKEMATHSSTIAWKIPWTEELDRLQSMGSQRVRHDWATSLTDSVPKEVTVWWWGGGADMLTDKKILTRIMHKCAQGVRELRGGTLQSAPSAVLWMHKEWSRLHVGSGILSSFTAVFSRLLPWSNGPWGQFTESQPGFLQN